MKTTLLLFSFIFSITSMAQIGGWNPKLEEGANKALEQMIEQTPKLETFKSEAFGYAVFPKVTKAGIGIGGAMGNGVVYKNNKVVGTSKLKQASVGLQLGGQQYSEVIFFENKTAYDHFTNGNLKFSAQASAVAVTEGASIDVAYKNGVAVFTRAKGGLMYEASIGGQHFKYEAKE